MKTYKLVFEGESLDLDEKQFKRVDLLHPHMFVWVKTLQGKRCCVHPLRIQYIVENEEE